MDTPGPIAARPEALPAARVGRLDCILEVAPGQSIRVDRLGRWAAVRFEGTLFRRTLDGSVVNYPDPRGWPQEVSDGAAVHRRVQGFARELARRFGVEREPLRLGGAGDGRPLRLALLDYLARAARWDAEDYEEQRRRFARAYDEPVEILPPDRTMDLVVLPASGCPNARCSFCAFYRGRKLRVKNLSDFRAHLAAVAALFDSALGLRKGVFLGSASAISLPQRRLLEVLELTRAQLGEFPRGVAAFWDPDHAPRRDQQQWEQLQQRGLRAVYVGLESGSSALRKALGKAPQIDALIDTLRGQLRTAITLGVIVLAGIGRGDRRDDHRHATAETIERLGLRATDIVFVSPLRGAMEPAELASEERLLRGILRRHTAAKVVPYAMDAFRYYA